jgi:PKD repeat protein
MGATLTHVFQDDGGFDVVVTCRDGDGGEATFEFTHDVLNVAPTASIVSVNVSLEGQSVAFSATAFDPGTLDTLLFTWDFGDSNAGSGQSTSHVYLDDGIYTVTLTVTDTAPASTVVVKTVRVDNVAPLANATVGGARIEGTALTFTAAVTDPGIFDTFSYLWQFGDTQSSTQPSPSHAFLDDGTYIGNVTVTDKDGGSTVVNFTLVIANAAPAVVLTAPPGNATEGVSLTFTLNATDAGALDTLTVTLDFGDGSAPATPAAGVGVTQQHAFPDEGNYTVTLTVSDGDGGTSTVSLTVAVLNAAPLLLAQASSYVLNEGERVNLTANATDLGAGDTVSIMWDLAGHAPNVAGPTASLVLAQEGTYGFTAVATDNDGAVSTLTLEVVVQNVAPTLVVQLPSQVHEAIGATFNASVSDPGMLDTVTVTWSWGDGAFSAGLSVAHAYGDVGLFTLTVTATDDAGGVDLQTFTMTVLNTAPRVVAIPVPADAREGALLPFNATVENLAGELVTYSWNFGDGSSSQLAAPSHGYRDNGQYTVTLTVSDADGGSSTLSATVQVENEPPVVQCDACPDSAVQGRTISVRVSAADPGRDDTFTFSLRLPDGNILTSTEGIFDFAVEAVGIATLTITAQDNDGATSSPAHTLTINVQLDTDRDGLPDATDNDDDNDGFLDADDPAPLDPEVPGISTASELPLLWILLALMAAGVGLAYVISRRRREGGGGGGT